MKFRLFISATLVLMTGLFSISAQSVDVKIADELASQSFVSNVVVKLKGHSKFQQSELPHDKDSKGAYVFHTLEGHAQRTQSDLLHLLVSHNVDHRQFVVANVIWITGEIDPDLLYEIAELDAVEFISRNETFAVNRAKPSAPIIRSAGVEWGIERIRADSVWTLGYTGQGVVVGGQDTGYEWDHPSLSKKYRGYSEDSVEHNYNWFDAVHSLSPVHNDTVTNPGSTPCGVDAVQPCDDNGHGTHTMGTILGSEGEDMIGVAPDAQWVGVRSMDRGYGSPITYLEAFEWFLAPTDVFGQNPNPALAPHVINNSWRCPEMEGCNPDNFGILEEAINNLRAAGVVVVVSAGNEGSGGCSSLDDPPSIFQGSFAVGATRLNDTIANFSSRGPVTIDGSGRTKPDVAAPGVAVRSAWLDSTYRFLNGTSMAGPHVVGTVALMISANPELAGQVDLIEDIIRETARSMTPLYDCSSDSLEIPNNTYGHGIVDALAAVERALEVTSSEEMLPGRQNVKLFPNPSTGVVNYILPTDRESRYDISVFDMRGRLIARYTDKPTTGSFNINHEGSGLYAIVLVDKSLGLSYTAKISVVR